MKPVQRSGVLLVALALTSVAATAAPKFQLGSSLPQQQANSVATDTLAQLVGPDGKANVIIVLKGEPTALAFARALHAGGGGVVGTSSAGNASRTAAAQRRSEQATFRHALDGSGVHYQEIYSVHRALNGIAARMTPADMVRVRKLPGVERVEYLPLDRPSNITSVPFISAPSVWDASAPGLNLSATGTGVRVGIIDTGIDFVHPDFGGTGLLADYQNIDPTSTTGVNLATVFPTAKIVGGTDFVGDDYDANNVPVPDPNPLDCNGHGSHVAGTVAGVGVNSDGTPYGGIYNPSTDPGTLRIGPGVAPSAELYALRVFGCGGSTSVVVEAIDWATDPNGDDDVSDRLDVINMSLGSPFGLSYDADAVASDNASATGMIVVASAGNSGDTFFIHGSPAASNSAISTAASVDSGIPGVLVDVSAPAPIAGNYPAVASAFTNPSLPNPPNPNGESANIVLAIDNAAPTSDGCTAFTNGAAMAGNIALVDRGTCSFFIKIQNAQAAGAIGVIVVNNVTGDPLPTTMGSPVTGTPITIPSVMISQPSGALIKAQLGGTVAATLQVANSGDTLASFSSRGAVGTGDSTAVKPDISAPGLSIPSVQTGHVCNDNTTTGCIVSNASGYIPGGQLLVLSGTSMAAPHMTGVMALLRQLNPSMSVEELKALAMNNAAHDVSLGADGTPPNFAASRVGAGRVDVAKSATGKILAYNADVPGAVSVTFNIEPVGTSSQTHVVNIVNHSAATQKISLALDSILDSPGATFSIVGSSGPITLGPGASTTTTVKVDANAALMKRFLDPTMSPLQLGYSGFGPLPRHYLNQESALLKVTDQSDNELARVPVYVAYRPHSTMVASDNFGGASGTTSITLSGQDVCTGTLGAGPSCTANLKVDEESLVSPFELSVQGAKDDSLPAFANLRYAGVNYLPGATAGTSLYYFGLVTYGKWNSPNQVAINVCVDTNNDGIFDRIIANTSSGVFSSTGDSQDNYIRVVYNPATDSFGLGGTGAFPNLITADIADTALLDNNVMIIGASPATLGVAAGVTKIHYGIAICPGYDIACGAADWTTTGTASCGNPSRAYQSFNGPFVYDAAAPGVDGTGNFLLDDLNGGSIEVPYNTANMAANGSNAMLLLHHHNTAATSAQVVAVDEVFKNGFED